MFPMKQQLFSFILLCFPHTLLPSEEVINSSFPFPLPADAQADAQAVPYQNLVTGRMLTCMLWSVLALDAQKPVSVSSAFLDTDKT